jgi:hypothetical protein
MCGSSTLPKARVWAHRSLGEQARGGLGPPTDHVLIGEIREEIEAIHHFDEPRTAPILEEVSGDLPASCRPSACHQGVRSPQPTSRSLRSAVRGTEGSVSSSRSARLLGSWEHGRAQRTALKLMYRVIPGVPDAAIGVAVRRYTPGLSALRLSVITLLAVRPARVSLILVGT